MSKMLNHWVILSVYILTFLIGLPANLLAICTFLRKLGDKPNPNDILLFNLTLSDLIFLFFLPFKMYEAAIGMKWYLPQTVCSVASYVFYTTIYTSSLLLTAIAVDRYLGVAFPFKYRRTRKPLHAAVVSALIWVICASHCTIVFVIVHMPGSDITVPKTVCYGNFTKEQNRILLSVRLEFFVVLFILPLLICVFCYINCIYILYTRPNITKEKKQRAIVLASCTLTIFLLCFLPYNISHLVGYTSNISPLWRHYTLLLSTLNTCLDPVIFFFSSSTFRNKTRISLSKMLHCGRSKATVAQTDQKVMSSLTQ